MATLAPMTVVSLGLPRPDSRASAILASAPDGTLMPRPDTPLLVDRYGRRARDLRVSLTDRCKLRCIYCMPPEGLDWLPGEQLLTDDEVVRLITIAVRDLGVEQVRFTGGEPLLRKGMERILAATTALRTASAVSRTPADHQRHQLGATRRCPQGGRAASDQRLPGHPRSGRYARIARRDRLSDVTAGLAAAADAGLAPIKINTVLMRGVNDGEAVPLVRWALERGYLRGSSSRCRWARGTRGSETDDHRSRHPRRFQAELTLVRPLPEPAAHRPPRPGSSRSRRPRRRCADSRHHRLGHQAVLRDCDRTRLTADGKVRSCLFARSETDLRSLLRGGASDTEIAETWRGTMWAKQPGHGIDQASFVQPERPMSSIGG